MKVKIICFICCVALMLNGCGISKIADSLGNKQEGDITEALSKVKVNESKIPEPSPAEKEQTASPTKETMPSENQSSKLPAAIDFSNTAQSSFEDSGILALVLSDADSAAFLALQESAMQYDFSARWNRGLELDKIIIAAQKDLTLSFESVYYEPSYDAFFEDNCLATTALKKGESILFSAYLTDGIPDFRVSVFAGGDMKYAWYNTYDGMGNNTPFSITADLADAEVVSYDSSIVNMAGAMVMSSLMVEGFDNYLCESIRHAITLDMDLFYGDENVDIPESIMAFYQQAMFPTVYPDELPEFPDDVFAFDPDSKTYNMAPLLYGDIASWKCVGISNNTDGNDCNIFIDAYYPDMFGEHTYSHYKIVFENNSKVLSETPFAYEVSEVSYIDLDDNYSLYYDFMETDEWKFANGEGSENGFIDDSFEYVDYILVDVDNNGVEELWVESSEWNPMFPHSVSGLYTIINGEVIRVISGYETGGSIGGNKLKLFYDTFTDSYVPTLQGHIGGFGGSAVYCAFYKYNGPKAEEIVHIMEETINDITTYYIDGEKCSEEDYREMSARFTEPEYDQYIFPEY